jgi:hypothetical protein
MGLRETIGRVLALLGLCGGRHLRLRGHLDRVSRNHPRGLGEMTAKGGIRRQEFPFLTQYGTPYALYDEQDDGYIHALKARSTDSVGTWTSAWKSRARLSMLAGKYPWMNVTKAQIPPGQ